MSAVRFSAWIAASLAITLAQSAWVGAAEQDASGTWLWTFTTPGGDTIQQKAKFKVEGDQLTGSILVRAGMELPIREGSVKGNEVRFQVVRERDGNKTTAQYQGTLKEDIITGKWTSNFGGEERTREWKAKRDTGKLDVSGNWRYSFTTSGGQTLEPLLKLKQEGDKLTGLVVFNQNETPISEGKINQNEISFRVDRERDGTVFTSRYQGKVEENMIKGKINSNWGGTERTYDFEARKQND